MKRSTDRILTTHVGSLVRPPDLLDLSAQAKHGGDQRPYEDGLRRSVAEIVLKDAFFTAVAPASVGYDAANEYYANERDYVYTIANALREEYGARHPSRPAKTRAPQDEGQSVLRGE
jgi:methionine synthase II (cobalamin-independent)